MVAWEHPSPVTITQSRQYNIITTYRTVTIFPGSEPDIDVLIHIPLSKPWSSHLWTQFKQLRIEAWKSQDFNRVWTRDLATPVRRSNQVNYEATDAGSWSFVSSYEPVKNGCEVRMEGGGVIGMIKPYLNLSNHPLLMLKLSTRWFDRSRISHIRCRMISMSSR